MTNDNANNTLTDCVATRQRRGTAGLTSCDRSLAFQIAFACVMCDCANEFTAPQTGGDRLRNAMDARVRECLMVGA